MLRRILERIHHRLSTRTVASPFDHSDLPFELGITFDSTVSVSSVVSLFRAAGFETRSSSWTETEIQNSDTDLTMIPDAGPLLTGGLRDSEHTFERVLAVLIDGGVSFTYELEDEDGVMIRQGQETSRRSI